MVRFALALLLVFGACQVEMVPGSDWMDVSEARLPAVHSLDLIDTGPVDALRVATYNVEFAPDPELFADTILADDDLSKVDVFLLQEIESYRSEGVARAQTMAASLDMNFIYVPSNSEDGGDHGLAILSSLPMSNPRVMYLPKSKRIIRPRNRIALSVDIVVDAKVVTLATVHLDVRLNIGNRISQVHPFVSTAAAPMIITGDYNTNPYHWSGSQPVLTETTTIGPTQAELFDEYFEAYGYLAPTKGSGPTQHSLAGDFRLDGIHTKGLSPGDYGVVRNLGISDHDPVWLDLTF
ncbi:MAG: endonuclease/exonuclease/phosphatase family protein [Myxococcales bacterium]|nr:endonuclease/exonuclease/phosphatase family protein [Myxococcales bacterium]